MRRAFSLIELMIGIALGLVVIATIYAGFRVASQTVTITDRLALENKLLVGGFIAAMDEVDHWWALDRPGEHEPLRTMPPFKTISAGGGGYDGRGGDWDDLPQPFTPFARSWSASGSGTAYASAWLANDPRTWYRGDGALRLTATTDRSAYGNYAIFQCADQQVIVCPAPADGAVTLAPEQRWLPDQHVGLKYALGFYGWLGYVPANALIDAYGTSGGRGIRLAELRDLDGSSDRLTMAEQEGHGRFRWQGGSGSGGLRSGAERAVTRPALLYTSQVGIAAFAPGADADTQRQRAMINRQMAVSRYAGSEAVSTYPVLLASIEAADDLIRTAPSHWPQVSADVRRTLLWGMVHTWCSVRMIDPTSGRMTELSFPTIGTTLRGARLARDLD